MGSGEEAEEDGRLPVCTRARVAAVAVPAAVVVVGVKEAEVAMATRVEVAAVEVWFGKENCPRGDYHCYR